MRNQIDSETPAFQLLNAPKRLFQSHLHPEEESNGVRKTFQCSECLKTFTRAHDLRRHERLHNGQKPYKCPHCPKSFSRSDTLQRHMSTCSIQTLYRKTSTGSNSEASIPPSQQTSYARLPGMSQLTIGDVDDRLELLRKIEFLENRVAELERDRAEKDRLQAHCYYLEEQLRTMGYEQQNLRALLQQQQKQFQ